MSAFINILKTIGLTALIIGILTAIGSGLNALIPWIWLTYVFRIMRNFLGYFNFMWDVTTLCTIIGITIQVLILFWAFKAGSLIYHHYHSK